MTFWPWSMDAAMQSFERNPNSMEFYGCLLSPSASNLTIRSGAAWPKLSVTRPHQNCNRTVAQAMEPKVA